MLNNNLKHKNIKELSTLIKYLKSNEINTASLTEITNELIISTYGQIIINIEITEKEKFPAKYVPETNTIILSPTGIKKWLSENGNLEINNFNEYLLLFLITHEIEHSYQKMTAANIVDSPFTLMSKCYQTILNEININKYNEFNTLDGKYLNFLNYISNKENYILERNANIEACDLVAHIAQENNDEYLEKIFLKMRNDYMFIGYEESNLGCVFKTMDEMGLLDIFIEYYDNEQILTTQEFELIRQGLPISTKTQQILKLTK